MGYYQYFDGTLTIDPPVPQLAGEMIDGIKNRTNTYRCWWVSDDGATLEYLEDEMSGNFADDRLVTAIEAIEEAGGKVNGELHWTDSGEEFGKWVIEDNDLDQITGFRAYEDGTTEYEDWECRKKPVSNPV